MSTKEQDQVASSMLDSLLDANLADIADLPEYADFIPTGFYKLKIETVERKSVEITDKESKQKVQAPVLQLVYSVQETLELEDQSVEKIKPNTRFNISYFFNKDPQKSLEVIKANFKNIAEQLGITNVAELIGKLQGLEVGATVKSKKAKDKEDTYYIQVSNAKLI
jgi:hypothetical protein